MIVKLETLIKISISYSVARIPIVRSDFGPSIGALCIVQWNLKTCLYDTVCVIRVGIGKHKSGNPKPPVSRRSGDLNLSLEDNDLSCMAMD